MSSFLFYDPDQVHHRSPNDPDQVHQRSPNDPDQVHQRSPNDPDITYVQRLDALDLSIRSDINLQRIVCICCSNKSSIIKAIYGYKHVQLIYLCAEHNGPEENPLHDSKVQESIMFDLDSNWKFTCRLALANVCKIGEHVQQWRTELQRLKAMNKSYLTREDRLSTEVPN
ncbi:hypothetical protein I4U23_015605 [Adineta vaga]|nr:hypothetical protein I4U23_015605 [Adineta vaga]